MNASGAATPIPKTLARTFERNDRSIADDQGVPPGGTRGVRAVWASGSLLRHPEWDDTLAYYVA